MQGSGLVISVVFRVGWRLGFALFLAVLAIFRKLQPSADGCIKQEAAATQTYEFGTDCV